MVALLLVGAAVGAAAVVTHELWHGLALAVLAALAGAWALPAGATTRLPFALGWVGVVGYALVPRGTGSYLIADDVNGYALLGLGLVLLLFAIVTLRPPHPEAPEPS